MSVLIAARTLGELGAWQLTHLRMQKVLYVAQMMHLGRTGTPLFDETFEAWEYGPVVPSLYHFLKAYGREPVQKFQAPIFFEGSDAFCAIADAFAMVRHMTPGQLVSYTHRVGGAWDREAESGTGGPIPNSSILDEFQQYMRPSDEAVDWACEQAADIEKNPPAYLDTASERAFGAHLLEVGKRQALH